MAKCFSAATARLEDEHAARRHRADYIISDRPMTEAEWIKERASTIDVTPEK
jgi:hypothetical protein